MKKDLKFSVSQLIIDGKDFDTSIFSKIKSSDVEIFDIAKKNKNEKEVLSIKKIEKTMREERFITIYSNEGNKFPYSDKVIDCDDCNKLKERKNPRSSNEIELDDQFFVLIDTQTQRIFISDQRRKISFSSWLQKKIEKTVIIKSIILEEQFIEKIRSVNKISFSLAPCLLNSQNEDTLSNKLVEDIYGFGAEKASIELFYKDTRITDKIIKKITSLIGRKNEFENITVIGRSDENFESIFNINEIISKILISIDIRDESKLLDKETIFSALISKIKQNESEN